MAAALLRRRRKKVEKTPQKPLLTEKLGARSEDQKKSLLEMPFANVSQLTTDTGLDGHEEIYDDETVAKLTEGLEPLPPLPALDPMELAEAQEFSHVICLRKDSSEVRFCRDVGHVETL